MHEAIASYRKTIVLSLCAGLVVLATAYAGQRFAPALIPTPLVLLFSTLGLVAGLALVLVALGGVLVSFRHSSRERGEQDLFLALNSARSESALLARAGRRWLGASTPRVGDAVRIRTLEEISATLDTNGCLNGLPFMPEMARYCGTTGTVFRFVDKVYDYGGKKDLRRMRDAVLITGLRCDGGAHDGCQARCYLLWKTAWITTTDAPARVSAGAAMPFGPTFVRDSSGSGKRYVCQFTEIVRASSKMHPWDFFQHLRPLIAGNVTLTAFGVAILTRLFNLAQGLRGGVGFPANRPSARAVSPRTDLNLQPGELVRVREPERIFETLDRSGRNRGLWFDRDMLKRTKEHHKVLARVDRIIDDASGRMLQMKTPCIVLDGVDASGELLGFCPQHDLPFWREAWLERIPAAAVAPLRPTEETRLMDPQEPLVSVLVPVYNGERFLRHCLDSLLAQTYRKFVLLISDNASTDGTREICESYAKADPRVRYQRNPVNVGMYGNLNLLLRLARTPFVKLASADDFWAPTMLADAMEQMQADPSLVLCHPRAVLVDEKGDEIRRYDKPLHLMENDPAVRFRRVLHELGLVNQLMGVMRTDAVRSMLPFLGFPPADSVFLAELSLHGKIMELPKFQYFRRFHQESSSWNRKSASHQIRLVSGAGTRRLHLATWKYHWGLARRVLHSPIAVRAKMELMAFLARRAAWDRAALMNECRQLLWPARASASSSEHRTSGTR